MRTAARPLLLLFLLVVPAVGGDEELQLRVEQHCAAITARLEGYLGPKFKAPVPVELKTKEEIGAFARELAKTQVPAGMLEVAQKLAERLHQVPPGYDLLGKEIEMVEQNVAGLYDADADRFYVVEGTGSPGSVPFMIYAAHELVHAYRDVDKDYWPRTLRLIHENSDEAQAVRFLVEGDATLLGTAIGPATLAKVDPEPFVRQTARQAGNSEMMIEAALAQPQLAEFPRAMKEALVAAYVEGMAFAAEIYRKGGKAALDAAYDRPPRSTEQVLHPEKYLGPDVDEPVSIEGGDPTAALGDGWKLLHSDVFGELDLRILLTEDLGRSDARAAAAGWDGARYWFCEREGAPSFIGAVTAWDSPEDASEFAFAWARWASLRDGGKKKPAEAGGSWRADTKEGLVVTKAAGSLAFVADGVPPGRVDAVLAAMAAARAVERTAE